MKRVVFLLCAVALISCNGIYREKKIRQAVENQMKLYPESTLQDLYKSFFQAEFGAEHLVSDTSAAGRYLDYELSFPDSTDILYEPIGIGGSYYRVHLVCVQRGYLSRDQLFGAFIDGVFEVPVPQINNWKEIWAHIASVIDEMNLEIQNYTEDREAIDSLLQSGHYAVHHSEHFDKQYHPHYRIIRGDIFEREILPFLPE